MRRILLACLFLCANTTTLLSQGGELFFKVSNQNPKEGEVVKITLDSYKYNLSEAKIIWFVDGVETDSGIGRKTFNISLTNQKPAQIISVLVEEQGLDNAQAQIVLEISNDFLLFEGYKSLTPLFYKGRSLPGKEGSVNVRLFSFENGDIVDSSPAQTSRNQYFWKINGQEKAELSGSGKAQNILNAGVVDNSLKVQVLRKNESAGKLTSLTIPFMNSEILLYRLSENKLFKSPIKENEVGRAIEVWAELFYFSAENKVDKNLKYTWKINNKEVGVSTPWRVVFSRKNNETAKITLEVKNLQKIIQDATKAFNFRVE